MPSNKNIIKGLILDEVSHVDDPSNKGSRVVLVKRATETKGGDQMKPEDLAKRLEVLEAQVPELEAALKSSEEKNKILCSAADAAGFDIQDKDGKVSLTKRAEPEYIDIEGDRILKSSVPAPLLARLEKQTKELEEVKKAAELTELKKRATEAFPNLVGTEDEKAALLKSIDGISDEAVRTSIMKSLKAADEAVAKSFKEIGSQTLEDDPKARLEKMAKEKAEAEGISYYTAFAEITKSGEGKKLAAQVQSKN